MKDNALTTVDDYTETWKKAARERAAMLEGHDPERKRELERAVHTLGG